MKLSVLGVALSVLTVAVLLCVCQSNSACSEIPPDSLNAAACTLTDAAAWQGDAYINGIWIAPEMNAFLEKDDALYVSVDVLNDSIPNGLLSYQDNQWFIRQHPLDQLQLYRVGDALYVALNDIALYARLVTEYLPMKIILLQINMPSKIFWNGSLYTFTRESSDPIHHAPDGITDDGRRMWFISPDLWVEDDDGTVYRFECIRYGVM